MTTNQKKPLYTPEEERANMITHGIGTLLSLIGMVLMLVITIRQQNLTKIIAASVYGVSLLFLYGSSTLYHYSKRKKTRDIFQLLDHAAIYLLIAGSYIARFVGLEPFWHCLGHSNNRNYFKNFLYQSI